MVGMLQIITYLLCVYIILKGIEIFQIGLMGTAERRKIGMAIGAVMIVASIGAAGVFTYLITIQANEIDSRMQNLPKMPGTP
jgi:uncharacterized membrane protein (DUF485 family)